MLPRGSGYLVRSDSSLPVEAEGFVGAEWSLPLFGMVRGQQSCYQIIETWWDAKVDFRHRTGEGSRLTLDWAASLGKLAYPRRVLIRFAENVDHLGMAKAYRRYLVERGQLSTLNQRAAQLPALRRLLAGVEYRWPYWRSSESHEEELVLDNIRRFLKAGIPITFFYPKWLTKEPAAGEWQCALSETPYRGGWTTAIRTAEAVHQLGCPVKVFVLPWKFDKQAPAYDASKATGQRFPELSLRYATWANDLMLDSLAKRGFRFDALYFDGYSAHKGFPEHGDSQGPVSRREGFEAQIACFNRTRSRGIVPVAELARFWSVGPCDVFFFTDWSRDRLREGEPIPLFPLVFHDCYGACFSGGGYYTEGKYDWYADRNPRLYELMYAAIPAHNWLPDGSRAVRAEDWGGEAMNRRLAWLRRWHEYYQKVCLSEMLSHTFLNPEHTLQRVEFAGGVSADFDLAKGQYRVHGVRGFSGDWEKPPEIVRSVLANDRVGRE